MGRKLFMEYRLISYWWNILFVIPNRIPYHSSIFVSVAILTNKVQVDNNSLDESCKSGYEKSMQVENIGPQNRLYNGIFLIVIYQYANNIFLLQRDITPNMYAIIVIWSLCYDYMICEIDNNCLQLLLMGLSLFINVYA